MSTAKRLGISFLLLAAVAFAAPAFAQDDPAAAPPANEAAPGDATATPAIDPVTGLPMEAAPEIDPVTGLPIDPAAAEVAPVEEAAPEVVEENPYGFVALFKNGDYVTWVVGVVLGIMAVGSWLIFVVKWLSSGRLIGQSSLGVALVVRRIAEDGINKLDRNNVFRSLAEDAQAAADQHASLTGDVSLSDWVGNALNRSIDNINSQLRGGNAFLATVASSAPFVGLFGTVYGILKALLAIGVSGQPSIDKVAGPVGEALIMTAIGLFAAVPAVIFYNVIVGRNRQVTDALRNFAVDVQSAILGGAPASSGRRR